MNKAQEQVGREGTQSRCKTGGREGKKRERADTEAEEADRTPARVSYIGREPGDILTGGNCAPRPKIKALIGPMGITRKRAASPAFPTDDPLLRPDVHHPSWCSGHRGRLAQLAFARTYEQFAQGDGH